MFTISALGCPPGPPGQPLGLPWRQMSPQMPHWSCCLWSRRVPCPKKPQPKPASILKHPDVSPPTPQGQTPGGPHQRPSGPEGSADGRRAGNTHRHLRPLAAALPGPPPGPMSLMLVNGRGQPRSAPGGQIACHCCTVCPSDASGPHPPETTVSPLLETQVSTKQLLGPSERSCPLHRGLTRRTVNCPPCVPGTRWGDSAVWDHSGLFTGSPRRGRRAVLALGRTWHWSALGEMAWSPIPEPCVRKSPESLERWEGPGSAGSSCSRPGGL